MKNSRNAIQKRQTDLLGLLRTHGKMGVNLIAEELNVTPATVRRDLTEMAEAGTVVREFGCAVYPVQTKMEEIEPTNIEDEKEIVRRHIAKVAADMIEDGDVVFLNSSGTASLVLEYLSSKSVTVITNNARIVNRMRGSRIQLILTGGMVFGKKQSLVGQYAMDTIRKITASKCILGVSGISSDGITSQILLETDINREMLARCSGPKIIVAEGSKIGLNQSFFSGNLQDATHLITDVSADRGALEAIRAEGLEVLCV